MLPYLKGISIIQRYKRKDPYSIFAEGRRKYHQGGSLKPHPRRRLAQDRSSEPGPAFLQPEEEEFQGPPELGVDTQVHQRLAKPCREPPSLLGSHQSHSLITHREALPQLLTEESVFSPPLATFPAHDRSAPGFPCLPVAHLVSGGSGCEMCLVTCWGLFGGLDGKMREPGTWLYRDSTSSEVAGAHDYRVGP